MSSRRETSVILPAPYTSSRREASSSSRARVNSTSLSVPTRIPAPRRIRPKATAASSIGGASATPHPGDEGGEPRVGGPLLVLAVLEDGADGCPDDRLVELLRPQGHERLRPVDGLGDAGGLVEVHRAELLDGGGDLAGEPLLGLGHAQAHDLDLPLEARVLDVEVEAAALEGVVHRAGAVRGEDGDGRPVGLYGADLGNGDGEVREDLEQESLELVVGAVHLVYEQNRRLRPPVLEGLQERTADEELVGVEVPLQAPRVLLGPEGLRRPDVKELPRVVPLVDGLEDVDALVALEPDQGRIQNAREDLGDLGLAHPGLALEKEW